MRDFFYSIGNFTLFVYYVFLNLFKKPYRINLIVKHLVSIGLGSIVIVFLTSLAIGLIFSLQMAVQLYRFGAPELSASIMGFVLSREMAPVFTTIMLIAKSGSAMTAEIGTMNISDQITALRTMSVDPLHYLVVPRLIASMVMFPLLSAFANLIGLISTWFVLFYILKIEYAFTVYNFFVEINPVDILGGIGKAYIMGIVVCLTCCYFGVYSKKSSSGVGRATTQAVVTSSVAILIVDFIIGKILLDIGVL